MLMGFSLLLALYVVALLLDLNATQLLLDNLGSSLVLVMVVLFQADIRNALAQFGLITLFRDTGLQRKNVVDSVLQSCIIMARQRVGALIVFEQDVGLRNYSERGVQINATVSEELVQSIFHPTSPLHDGAVILNRKGELVAARCILPVSMNSRLDQDLGTRHRAAIGLTEETDAVVLVVSEERKEISLSYKGQLLRGANENIRVAFIQVLEGKVPETLQKKPEAEKEEVDERVKIFSPMQVNNELIQHAKNDYMFMHCLPAERGREVTDQVIDSQNSIVFEQAENRLHTQNAIMVTLANKV